MTFEEILDQAIAMLQRRGRLTYGALKRQFQLDDAYLEDLKAELIEGQRLAVDEAGRVLVWIGETETAPVAAATAETPVWAPLTYTPPYLAEKILTSRSALEGERKLITVLFADLRGSMELLAERDPEEARQLLDPVLERMMEAVHRYEGTVNQVMGDGIMALFGAPIAHEDHAVRACYSALRMQETVRQYAADVQRTQGVPLHIRVGLNAGEVVVRAIGSDLHMDYTAVGQTTHLAARMEQIAMPGSILITAAVLALAEGFIEVRPLGPVPVKGLVAPVEVYEVVDVGLVRTRLQAAVARGLTRFVGRDPELDTLRQALARAGSGHGQVVALVGEAGVGKSRLVYEFLHARHTQGWLTLASSSGSYGKATPYLPVIDLLKGYCGIDSRDDLQRRREKVTGKLLTLDRALESTLPAFLALLEVPVEDPQWQAFDPLQRRQRTLEAVKRLLVRESQVQPLCLVFEDLHWIDSETQALLDSLVESLPTTRLLLLINYRPEYQHTWGSKTSYTQLWLDPLPPTSTDELLQALLGSDPSLAPLTQLLIARTQGNPFFLEECVRTLVETGVLVGERGAYRLAQPLESLQVPATVQAVLAARIDRLPPEDKRLLQTAAVIGTEVPWPLLHAIADAPNEALHRGLAHLQAAEFLYETSLFPERAYTFKHALTHEVAYGALLQERRRGLHARIVAALEAAAGDRLDEQVDWLAHHALRGQLWDKAVRYYRQVGAKARARSATREEVVCYEQALAALQHLPASRATHEQAIDLRLDLEGALILSAEFGQRLDHLCTAETLAQALDDQRRLGRVAASLIHYWWQTGDYHDAIEAGQHALAAAGGDVGLQVWTHFHLGQVYYTLGDYRRAIDVLGQNVAILHGALGYERFGLVGLPAVLSRTWLCWCLTELGAFTEGLTTAAEGLRVAEEVNHPFSLVEAYRGVSLPHLYKGDVHRAIPALERGLGILKDWDIRLLSDWFAVALGYAYAQTGRTADALALLEQEEVRWRAGEAYHTRRIVWVSEAYLRAGRLAEAHRLAMQALEPSRTRQEHGTEARALWLLGAIATHHDPPDVESAEDAHRQALALAEELGMRPLQAHCHHGLGTLYATIGQREQARAELSTAIEMYHAMEMTFWLPQAEAVLAQVKGQ